MNFFGSTSGAKVDEFARALAQELVRYLPPAPGPKGPTPKQIYISCETVFAKALAFKKEHKLGIYKKARLGNTFGWELKALGYDAPFAEEVTQRLVLYIAGKR